MQNIHRIVFVGDSLTDGAAWPDWVVRTLNVNGRPDVTFANAGICGDTIALVKARYATDVLALKPDVVVMCIGVNDVIRKDPRERCMADMDEVLGGIRASGARVLLLTPPALGKPEYNAELMARKPLLKQLASRHGCTLGDLHELFEQSIRAGKRLLGGDGIHHEIDGWRTMGRCTLDGLGCNAPMIEEVIPYPGSVTDWFISPPVPWAPDQVVPAADPTAVSDPVKAGWRRFDRIALRKSVVWHDAIMLDQGGVMPLGSPATPRGSGTWAATTLHSPTGCEARLLVGGSSPLLIWLNGEQVWDGRTAHGFHPNADRVTIRLKKGANQIAAFSTWLFHVSIFSDGQDWYTRPPRPCGNAFPSTPNDTPARRTPLCAPLPTD